MTRPVVAPDQIADIAGRARESGAVALDTEFIGEGRYRPMLCLVQVAFRDPSSGEVEVRLIDPLADSVDPAPLAAALADPQVEVIVHAGRQDVAILRRSWDAPPRPVFDTQVAAAFVGLGAQIGYGSLVERLTGRRLPGSATFTQWDRRPLTEEQLDYAREDVLDLLDVADELKRMLTEAGRLEWAVEECRAVEVATDEREAEEAWRRLPRVNRLSSRQRAVAREVAAWREQTAAAADRPLAQVCSDASLVEVARRRPRDRRALSSIRGMRDSTVRRHGEGILAAVARGEEAEPIADPSGPRRRSEAEDLPVVSICEALVRHRTHEAGIAYELVASRAELTALVTARRLGQDDPGVRVLGGWRRALVGEELIGLLEGKASVAVSPDHAIEVERRGKSQR